MKQLAKRLFKAMAKDNGSVGKDIDTHIPDYTRIEDPAHARQVMKDYLERSMAACERRAGERTKTQGHKAWWEKAELFGLYL